MPHDLIPAHGAAYTLPMKFVSTFNWLRQDYQTALIAVAAATLVVLLLVGVRKLLTRLERVRTEGWQVLIASLARRTKIWFLIALAARLVTAYIAVPAELLRTITFLFVIAATLQGAIWVRALIVDLVEQRAAKSGHGGNIGSAINIIRLLVSVAVFAIAAILVLDNLGVNVTGLVAGLGIGGIAIGLAAQGIFSDLFAALSIIFDKPFRVGDVITYSGKEGPITGTVEEIGLKSTRIRALTGEMRIIGNAQLLAQEVTNYAGRELYRFHLLVGVTYQTPADAAEAIPDLMRDRVEAHGHRFVRANFKGFGASSLDYELYFEADVDDIAAANAAFQKVSLAIFREFGARGIDFAYPTQTNFTAAPDGTVVMPYPVPGEPRSVAD